MKKIKFLVIAGFLLILILLNLISAATTSSYSSSYGYNGLNYRTNSYDSSFGFSGGSTFNSNEMCNAGQDFVLQINPFECTPQVVRSDLLEETNVPVFCPVLATNINPLIDINRIKTVSFNGAPPKGVAKIGYYPANAAIRKGAYIESGIMEKIGYVVIVLQKTPREADMPEWVGGNVSAKINYDLGSAFGTGSTEFFVPELTSDQWETDYAKYSFWNGRGILRVEDVGVNNANVAIYADKNNRITSVSLTKGQTSSEINLEGGSYCQAGIKLRLVDVGVPKQRARLRIDDEIVEVPANGLFLENRCIIKSQSLTKTDKMESVIISCEEDSGKRKDFTLKITCNVTATDNLGNSDLNNYYTQSRDGYEDLANTYTDVLTEKIDGSTYGEEGLKRAIYLAGYLGQEMDKNNLIELLKEKYPNTIYDDNLNSNCSYSDAQNFAFINGKERRIFLEGIFQPSKEESGVTVTIKDESGNSTTDTKGIEEQFDISTVDNKYLRVKTVSENSVSFTTNVEGSTGFSISKGGEKTIFIGPRDGTRKSYTISVNDIQVKRAAMIQVLSSVENAGSNASFSFKIGIEKRAFNMTPEQVKNKIERLNKSIEKWSEISGNLGTVVKGFKAACFGSATVITMKNLLSNAGGKATARTEVMNGYWRDFCKGKIDRGEYTDYDQCYYENGDAIDKSVDSMYSMMKVQNEKIKQYDATYAKDGFVDDSAWKKNYFDKENIQGKVYNSLNARNVDQITVGDNTQSLSQITGSLNPDDLTKDEIIKLERYSMIMEGNFDESFKQDVQKNFEKDLTEISALSVAKKTPVIVETGAAYKTKINVADRVLRYNKGVPEVVPLRDNVGSYGVGWYAKDIAFKENKEVKDFYVCNVGSNGKMDSSDVCRKIETAVGRGYSVPELSEDKSKRLVSDAISTIESAYSGYKPGADFVNLNGMGKVKVGATSPSKSQINCADLMSPKDCNLLFNVCDPVICPSSRCDLGGKYHVQDVIQSGIVGSVALCLPNWKVTGGDVYVPVCLTGIKAGIDGFISIMQAYHDCLNENLKSGKVVGICDEIHSIYMCEFFWKQAVPIVNLAIPKIIDTIFGSGVKGGGEYLGFNSAWENAQKSVDYMVNSYGINSYKAFKARTTDDVGTEVCKTFISARYPTSSEFFDALIEPDSPAQFSGRFDEINVYEGMSNPSSQYKIWYHIYAGKDQGAYYQVYLKGRVSDAFYQDSARRMVASNYVKKGEYVDQTADILAPSGYKELCIVVNKQEECGFKQVSTSFAVDYVKDKYMEEQATDKNIKTASGCTSGTASLYALAAPNIQQGADEVINPAIYDRGIIRVCSTANPAKGTDVNIETPSQRWVDVGYCDDPRTRCWIDTKSLNSAIDIDKIRNSTLSEITPEYIRLLDAEKERSQYVVTKLTEFENAIDYERDDAKLVKILEELRKYEGSIGYPEDKARWLFIKSKAYEKLAINKNNVLNEYKKRNSPTEAIRIGGPGGDSVVIGGYDCFNCPEYYNLGGNFCSATQCQQFGTKIGKTCRKNSASDEDCAEVGGSVTPPVEKTCQEMCDDLVSNYNTRCDEDACGEFASSGCEWNTVTENCDGEGGSVDNPVADGSVEIEIVERTSQQVFEVMQYAQQNELVNRKCSCGASSQCQSYAEYIVTASEKYNIPDPLFLVSLMMQESSCINSECNSDNYGGLMQICCKTNTKCATDGEYIYEWKTPEKNIDKGAKHLKEDKYSLFDIDTCQSASDCDDHPYSQLSSSGDGKKDCVKGKCVYYYGKSVCGIEKYYGGWSAALRAYNGWACSAEDSQNAFTDEVLERYEKLKEYA